MSSWIETRRKLELLPQGMYRQWTEEWNTEVRPAVLLSTKPTSIFWECIGTFPEEELTENPAKLMSGTYLYDPKTKTFMEMRRID